MDYGIITGLSLGVPMLISVVGLGVKVGRWNGRVTTAVESIVEKMDRQQEACDRRMADQVRVCDIRHEGADHAYAEGP